MHHDMHFFKVINQIFLHNFLEVVTYYQVPNKQPGAFIKIAPIAPYGRLLLGQRLLLILAIWLSPVGSLS